MVCACVSPLRASVVVPTHVLLSHRSVVNDSYRLDVCLFVPPYMIALAAIRIACAFMELDVTDWFDRLNVNGAEVCVAACFHFVHSA
jgi:hypothetical protein